MDILETTQRFEQLWEQFIATFKGSLITEARKQHVNLTLAKILLKDAAESWTADYGVNGVWLKHLKQDEPKKGELVEEILTHDLTLQDVKIAPPKPNNALKVAAPIGAGVAGLAVAKALSLGTVATATAVAVPAALALPIVNARMETAAAKRKQRIIDAYVQQIDKYKESIKSILLAE